MSLEIRALWALPSSSCGGHCGALRALIAGPSGPYEQLPAISSDSAISAYLAALSITQNLAWSGSAIYHTKSGMAWSIAKSAFTKKRFLTTWPLGG